MINIPQVCEALTNAFTETADEKASETDFVQRRSKLSGANFVPSLVFGWLKHPDATLEQLVQTTAGCRMDRRNKAPNTYQLLMELEAVPWVDAYGVFGGASPERTHRRAEHRAVGYVRRSTDRQEQSISDQKRALGSFAPWTDPWTPGGPATA